MSSLKELLAKKLTTAERDKLRTAQDLIGDIAIIDVPRVLIKKQKIIASAVRAINPFIKVVAKKVGAHSGKHRTQKLIILAGEKRYVTVHKEWGLTFHLDVHTCYFSPRTGTERMRIARLVKTNERVLVMFSGIGPYCLVIGKHSAAGEVVGVELNPSAHKYAIKNRAANKLAHISFYKGSVSKVVPGLGLFDRVVMPLPKTSTRYLQTALAVAKKGTMLHVYVFAKEKQFASKAQAVLQQCARFKKCKLIQITRTAQTKPREYRICVDILVQ